jgi:arylsulfatase
MHQQKKQTQYFEMVGTRGIWHNGWMAVTEHGPVAVNLGHFDKDVWELYHTDVDRSQTDNVAAQEPGKGGRAKKIMVDEAEKNHVLPLNDLDVPSFHKLEYHTEIPA